MNAKNHFSKLIGTFLVAMIGLGLFAGQAHAQAYPNTITFQNQSGEDAVVKLVGPVRWSISVPNWTNRTVNVPAGNYYILTRYCDAQGRCTYTKGDPFVVEQTETQYSVITITLQPVPNGNYHTYPTTAVEFDEN